MLLQSIFVCILFLAPNTAQLIIPNYELNSRELFWYQFTAVISFNPDLAPLLDHQIPSNVAKKIFSELDKEILESCGFEFPDYLANQIAEATGAKEYLSLDFYFFAVGVSLFDVCEAFGLPIDQSLAQIYADSLTDALKYIDVNDNELLLSALLDAYVNIIVAQGIDYCNNIEFMTSTFAEVLIDLNNAMALKEV